MHLDLVCAYCKSHLEITIPTKKKAEILNAQKVLALNEELIQLYTVISNMEVLRSRSQTYLAIFSLALLLSLLANFGMILLLVEKSK